MQSERYYEKKVNTILDFSLKRIKKLGYYITYSELDVLDVHPAIKQYISGHIDYLIFTDRNELLKKSSFDYNSQKLSIYFDLIKEELKRTKKFSYKFFAESCKSAIEFNLSYLAQPRKMIEKLVYKTSNHRNVNEIIVFLEHIYFYKYFKTVMISHLEKEEKISVNKEEFKDILFKLDKWAITKYSENVFESAVTSMAEFYNIGNNKSKNELLNGPIILFLEEKSLLGKSAQLKKNYGNSPETSISISEVLDLLIQSDNSVLTNTSAAEELSLFDTESEIKVSNEKTKKVDDTPLFGTLIEETKEDSETIVEVDRNDEVEDLIDPKSINEDIPDEDYIEIDISSLSSNYIENEITENKIDNTKENILENLSDSDDLVDIQNILNDDNSEINVILETDDIEPKIPEKSEELEDETKSESKNEIADNDTDEVLIKSVSENEPELENSDEISNNSDTKINNSIELNIEPETNTKRLSIKSIKTEANSTNNFRKQKQIEFSEMMDNKKIPKIVQVIFDYDLDDFADSIDELSNCLSKEEAFEKLDRIFERNGIKQNIKEAQLFKSIIAEYF